jgi:chromosome segregation ATPase
MQRITLSGMILGLLLLCTGGVLLASEADELRERAQAMRKKASVVAEQGDKELAERLERESVELLQAAERMELQAKGHGERQVRPGIDKEVQQLKERLQDLLAKEQKIREVMKDPEAMLSKVHEQISATERELQAIHAHQAERGEHRPDFQAQAEKLAVASRRIQHLRVAAENLKLAEEHDLAHKLMEQAEAMERDVQKAKQRLAAEMNERHGQQEEHGPEVVRELRAEIERLRAEVKELSRKIEDR